MRWAVIGANGMLGSDLKKYLEEKGEVVRGFTRENLNLDGDLQELKDYEVLVNCIAYTKVDLAETQVSESYFANAVIPKRLASYAGSERQLIHVSSDYVFDGHKGAPYLPLDTKNPLGSYGRSKSEGEDAVLNISDEALVVRTSWLYGANGSCFPRTIARQLLAGNEVPVISDQVGSPTYTLDLADFIHLVGSQPTTERILHGVSSGGCSWFEFANAIADTVSARGAVKPISTASISGAALRPRYSVLAPSRIAGWDPPGWQEAWGRAAENVLADL